MTLCDSHIHVVADPAAAPMVAARTYTPGVAPLATVQAAGAPLGVGRFVIVQPSFYGTDNAVLVEALAALGGEGRGVAVVDAATVAPGALQALHAAGVRGLRINLYSTLAAQGARPLDAAFADTAAVAARMGWHVEVLAAIGLLHAHEALLAGSPVPVVIDHYGLHGAAAPGSADGAALLRLMGMAHVWTKLSAPYRVMPDELAVRPDADWLRAMLGVAGARCVWGSDWPHTPPHEGQTGGGVPLPYRALDYRAVVDGFRGAVGDPALADRIMGANPARLYGWEAA